MAQGNASEDLRLYFLGAPRIELGGDLVRFDTRKAVALLAYLAVRRGGHSREALAALFWPEYEPSRAYANLRRTLWAINRALGKEWLAVDPESVALETGPGLWTDVDVFRKQAAQSLSHGHGVDQVCDACLTPLAAAAAQYRDDFMTGFTLPDSPAYDEWQFFETEGLRQEAASVLERLARCHSARGEYEEAITQARRWLGLDTWHEPAHRRLMQLYAWSGQRAAALRQYHTCARILGEELGVSPEAETTRLFQHIESGMLGLPAGADGAGAKAAAPKPAQLESSPQPCHNLPCMPTPFVGRSRELAEIAGLVHNPDCRLLTLVGPGGIGKTRLALAALENAMLPAATATIAEVVGGTDGFPSASSPFAQGVFFVPLAPLESADFLVQGIADALGFGFYQRAGEEPQQQLLNYLRQKQMLILLDNFEHLLEGAGLVSEILVAAPQIKVLVTSRERLNLRGEWVLPVSGMQYPDDGEGGGFDPSQSEYSAIQLFLQRARMADLGFSPTGDEIQSVVRICRLVGGMPLGIELAAAWVRVLPVGEIAAEIEQSLGFLTASGRDVPQRHHSLRAVCDHSWQLLSDDERAAFSRLSVFRGGFDRKAATQVASARLLTLTALVDKSLLQCDPSGRYSIHEVLRQYAAERLDASLDAVEETRDRHSDYYLGFLHQREKDLKGARQIEALDEVDAEIENVWAAWRWAAVRCKVRHLRQAAEALFAFAVVRKGFTEGERAFGEAVEALNSASCQSAPDDSGQRVELDLVRGLLLAFQAYFGHFIHAQKRVAGLLRRSQDLLRPLGPTKELALANWMTVSYWVLDDPAEIERMIEESLAIFEKAGDKWGIARCLHQKAYVYFYDPAERLDHLQRSLALSQEVGDLWSIASCLFSMGEESRTLGSFEAAEDHYEHCLEIRRRIGDRQGLGIGYDYLGYLEREMGRYDVARRLHQESLDISEQIGDLLGVAGSLDNLGLVARDEGNLDEARKLFEAGLDLRRKISHGWETAISLEQLGLVHLEQGQVELAEKQLRESLAIAQDAVWHYGTALALSGLGQVLARQGKVDEARSHVSAALSLGELMGNNVALLDIVVAAGRLLADMGEVEQALEALAFVAGHPAAAFYTRNRATQLLEELAAQLPSETLAQARAQAQSRALELVAEDLQARLSRR